MHPTAKRCIEWAVVLLILGAILLVYGTDAYVGLTKLAGANADVGLDAVNIILTLVRSALFPMGAVLIGVAIVIQTMIGPGLDTRGLDHDRRNRQ